VLALALVGGVVAARFLSRRESNAPEPIARRRA
jgi:hypothetical protein